MDYSQFYFRNFKRTITPEKCANTYATPTDCPEHTPQDERHVKAEKSSALPAKKKKLPKQILLAVVIILCFALTITCTEILSGGAIAEELKAAFNETWLATKYAVTTCDYELKSVAESKSLSVIQLGGAGYILENTDGYCVIIAIYSSSADAKSVAKKNDNLNIKELSLQKTSSADYAEITEADKLLNKVVDNLIVITNSLDEEKITYATASSQLSNMRNELLTKKDTLYNADVPTETLNKCILRIDSAFGCLDAICSEDFDVKLTQKIRRATAIITCGMLN